MRRAQAMLFASSKRALSSTKHGDLLAVLDRARERARERAVAADAVERLLDRQHVRILGGLLEEAQHRIERLVRVVQQHVAALDQREHRVRVAQRARDDRRATSRRAARGAGPCLGQREQIVDLQRPVDAVHVGGAEPERASSATARARSRRSRRARAGPRRRDRAGAAPPGSSTSRSSDSVSSRVRSQLRSTRNGAVCSTAKPGKRSPTWAAIRSSSSMQRLARGRGNRDQTIQHRAGPAPRRAIAAGSKRVLRLRRLFCAAAPRG